MQIRAVFLLATLLAEAALGSELPATYADAHAVWERTKGSVAYQGYIQEFVQFNNHFRLDHRDGCHAHGQGQVNLMLVITHRHDDQFAMIERVLVDVDNDKARCFRRSYEGVRTKVPPFVPFVLQMSMQ